LHLQPRPRAQAPQGCSQTLSRGAMIKWPGPLCQTCVCESQDDGKRGRSIGQPFDSNEDEVTVPLHWAPKVRGFPTYSSAPDQALLGVPIREGGLWHLSTQDRFEPVSFSLFVNGFAFSTPDGMEASVSLSPFSLVRNCRFQSGACSQLKSFKVSLLDHDPCCYFAVRSICEREAEEERSEWVLGISYVIGLITDSILPPFSITCDPLPNVVLTHRRLVAGYLIHRDDVSFTPTVEKQRDLCSMRMSFVSILSWTLSSQIHRCVVTLLASIAAVSLLTVTTSLRRYLLRENCGCGLSVM